MEMSIAKMQTSSPLFYISLTSRIERQAALILTKTWIHELITEYLCQYRPLPTVCSFLLQHCPNHWAVPRHLPHLPSRTNNPACTL
ncbi:hypothetical protein MRB53_010339 [Persea americana]|uniref:Uncharacterized protein n=1 Tax=Persea americana TaxID=3435 RepID=A0ACC2LRL3_PERAE|nr:hypothetical protein MRB53_010339 [Persea americana]